MDTRIASIAATTGIVCAVAYLVCKTRMVHTSVEEQVESCLHEIDAEEMQDGTEYDVPSQKRRKRFRRQTLIAKVTRKLKERFQIIEKPMDVDRIAVRKYAVDVMKEMVDISDVDIARVAPIAAELFWAYTATELVAAQVRSSAAVLNTRAQYNRGYFANPLRRVMGWFEPARAL